MNYKNIRFNKYLRQQNFFKFEKIKDNKRLSDSTKILDKEIYSVYINIALIISIENNNKIITFSISNYYTKMKTIKIANL